MAADVTGRPKHLWSIYEKMVVRGKEFDDINDLVAIRVVVDSEKDCWAALGAIHAIWAPVQGRFKDYINTPKFNIYQSLHTTVIGLDGKPIEVQIRTHEMHHRAEYGIAAHWGYKEKEATPPRWPGCSASSTSTETADPIEFLEALKLDLEQDEVYVFTPKGKVIALPARSTPVDFAYVIHTEVGHRCIGAQGQRPAGPARDHAQLGRHRRDLHLEVARRRARPGTGCRSSPRRGPATRSASGSAGSAARTPSRTVGRSCHGRCGGTACPLHKLLGSAGHAGEVAESMHLADLDALYAAIGENQVSAQSIVQRLARAPARRARTSSSPTRPAGGARGPRQGRRTGPASTSRVSTTS